jgi:hypothetical protein
MIILSSLLVFGSITVCAAVPVFAVLPPINLYNPDLDGIFNPPMGKDNCPNKSNHNQLDNDKDGKGNARVSKKSDI